MSHGWPFLSSSVWLLVWDITSTCRYKSFCAWSITELAPGTTSLGRQSSYVHTPGPLSPGSPFWASPCVWQTKNPVRIPQPCRGTDYSIKRIIQNSHINKTSQWGEGVVGNSLAFPTDIFTMLSRGENSSSDSVSPLEWSQMSRVQNPDIFSQLRPRLASQFNNTAIVLKYRIVPTRSQPLWLFSKGLWNVFQNVLKSDCLISARLRKIYIVAPNYKPNKWNVNVDL